MCMATSDDGGSSSAVAGLGLDSITKQRAPEDTVCSTASGRHRSLGGERRSTRISRTHGAAATFVSPLGHSSTSPMEMCPKYTIDLIMSSAPTEQIARIESELSPSQCAFHTHARAHWSDRPCCTLADLFLSRGSKTEEIRRGQRRGNRGGLMALVCFKSRSSSRSWPIPAGFGGDPVRIRGNGGGGRARGWAQWAGGWVGETLGV